MMDFENYHVFIDLSLVFRVLKGLAAPVRIAVPGHHVTNHLSTAHEPQVCFICHCCDDCLDEAQLYND